MIVSDSATGTVVYVGEARTKQTLKHWYDQCSPVQLAKIESVSMDMRPAYIGATRECVSGADQKIAFDRFRVAKRISERVDKVRRQENKELAKAGVDDLNGAKCDCLTNMQNMSEKQKKRFQSLKNSSLKTARAWAIKETSQKLWHYVSRTWARKGWEKWLS